MEWNHLIRASQQKLIEPPMIMKRRIAARKIIEFRQKVLPLQKIVDYESDAADEICTLQSIDIISEVEQGSGHFSLYWVLHERSEFTEMASILSVW